MTAPNAAPKNIETTRLTLPKKAGPISPISRAFPNSAHDVKIVAADPGVERICDL